MSNYFEGNKQGYCPKCGKEIVDWCDSSVDGDYIDFMFVCDCGFTGCETYELTYRKTCGSTT